MNTLLLWFFGFFSGPTHFKSSSFSGVDALSSSRNPYLAPSHPEENLNSSTGK